jgi:ketosteroid isomerase-like protein
MATKPTEQELMQLERSFWQALKDRDAETAAKLTADGCIITGAQGVATLDRQSMASLVEQAPYRIDAFRFGDGVKVQQLGDDVAVVAYPVHEELTVDGRRVSVDALDSSTWVRRDGAWRCALHTEALKGDPYGRDKGRDGAKADDLAESVRAIRVLIERWIEGTQSGDVDTVLTLMTDDVIFTTPGRKPFGKLEFAALPTAKGVQIRHRVEEITVHGDFAWSRVFLEVDGREGHTLSLLRRQPDGRWLVARDSNTVG